MNEEILNNLLDDLATSYRIVANDKDKMKLSRYYKTLSDFIIEYKTLQSNWNSLREWLEEDLKIIYRDCGHRNNIMRTVLDKMNELEGKDNNE